MQPLQYTARQDGKVSGPFTMGQVRIQVRQGVLSPAAEISVVGTDDWQPVSAVMTAPSDEPAVLHCQSCRRTPAQPASLPRVVSVVLLTFRTRLDRVLCDDCLSAEASKRLLATAAFGFLGVPIGWIRSPGAIARNFGALRQVGRSGRALALLLLGLLVPAGIAGLVLYLRQAHTQELRLSGREMVSKPAVAAIDASRRALAAGNLRSARSSAEEAVKLAPDSWVAHQALGMVAAKLEDHQTAIAEFTRATEINGESPDLEIQLDGALLEAGRIDESQVRSDAALKRWPQSSPLHLTHLVCRAVQQRFDDVLSELPAVSPQDFAEAGLAQIVDLAASAVTEAGGATRALVAVEAALKIGPEEKRFLLEVRRISTLCTLGRLDDAQRAAEQLQGPALPLDLTRAVVLAWQANYAKAARLLEDAVGDDSGDAALRSLACLDRGAVLLRDGAPKGALAAWGRAPKPAAAGAPDFAALACRYLTTGEGFDRVEAAATEPRVEHSSYANDLPFIRAMRLEATGDRAAARAAYQHCLDASPHQTWPYPLAKAALAALADKQ